MTKLNELLEELTEAKVSPAVSGWFKNNFNVKSARSGSGSMAGNIILNGEFNPKEMDALKHLGFTVSSARMAYIKTSSAAWLDLEKWVQMKKKERSMSNLQSEMDRKDSSEHRRGPEKMSKLNKLLEDMSGDCDINESVAVGEKSIAGMERGIGGVKSMVQRLAKALRETDKRLSKYSLWTQAESGDVLALLKNAEGKIGKANVLLFEAEEHLGDIKKY